MIPECPKNVDPPVNKDDFENVSIVSIANLPSIMEADSVEYPAKVMGYFVVYQLKKQPIDPSHPLFVAYLDGISAKNTRVDVATPRQRYPTFESPHSRSSSGSRPRVKPSDSSPAPPGSC